MDRRLLFPAIAATAWAQQVSPATAEAEKAVRARAEQFYQLEVEGVTNPSKFRQAEGFVAEDSKDYFYVSNKPTFKGFSYMRSEFTGNNTRAKVTVKIQAESLFPGVGAVIFDVPSTSNWKLENGQWYWYFDKEDMLNTPFGRMNPGPDPPKGIDMTGKAPDLETLRSQVSIDRHTVFLTAAEPVQTVTVSNDLPGGVTLKIGDERIEGLTTELDKADLKQGEKAIIRFRRVAGAKPSGIVRVIASPLNLELEVQVKSE